jgi:hypothetical protein
VQRSKGKLRKVDAEKDRSAGEVARFDCASDALLRSTTSHELCHDPRARHSGFEESARVRAIFAAVAARVLAHKKRLGDR